MLTKRIMTGKGVGGDRAQPKDGKTMEEEAQFFTDLYKDKDKSVQARKASAQKMTDTFYDLVTDFYESGWGQSFHFAPRGVNESFRESIRRHEHFIAASINLQEGDHALDMGCGIGGPMRTIAEFTGARVTGVTINDYQVRRGNQLNAQVGLDHLCLIKQGDFCKLEYKDNTFDKAFCIEASCHAADRKTIFREALRVLKPGGLFATYEWVTTKDYDPTNPAHVDARQKIEEGNSLPELIPDKKALEDLLAVGFELVKDVDVAEFATKNGQRPWYCTFEAGWNWESLPHTKIGMAFTHGMCWTLETLRLAPKGTYQTHQVLLKAKDGLLAGGQMGIFTPMYLVVARKPLKKKA
jgi:sterol 24-C-methyltransferase